MSMYRMALAPSSVPGTEHTRWVLEEGQKRGGRRTYHVVSTVLLTVRTDWLRRALRGATLIVRIEQPPAVQNPKQTQL